MTQTADLDSVLFTVEKQMAEYNVLMDEVMERWGVRHSVEALREIFKNPPMGAETFVSSWMKILNVNLESAIWLCVYHRQRLEKSQKDAIKEADEAIKNYAKETKNAF